MSHSPSPPLAQAARRGQRQQDCREQLALPKGPDGQSSSQLPTGRPWVTPLIHLSVRQGGSPACSRKPSTSASACCRNVVRLARADTQRSPPQECADQEPFLPVPTFHASAYQTCYSQKAMAGQPGPAEAGHKEGRPKLRCGVAVSDWSPLGYTTPFLAALVKAKDFSLLTEL